MLQGEGDTFCAGADVAWMREVTGRALAEVRDLTVRTIANIRATDEAREGFRAFRERRQPNWQS